MSVNARLILNKYSELAMQWERGICVLEDLTIMNRGLARSNVLSNQAFLRYISEYVDLQAI